MNLWNNFRLFGLHKKLVLTYDNNTKTDGVGAQLQRIYGIYSISRLLGASYLHSPLGCVDYQGLFALEENVADPGFHHEFNDLFQIKSDVMPTDDFHKINLPDISMEYFISLSLCSTDMRRAEGQVSYNWLCRTELPIVSPIATKYARRYPPSHHLFAKAARYALPSMSVGPFPYSGGHSNFRAGVSPDELGRANRLNTHIKSAGILSRGVEKGLAYGRSRFSGKSDGRTRSDGVGRNLGFGH